MAPCIEHNKDTYDIYLGLKLSHKMFETDNHLFLAKSTIRALFIV